MVPNLFVVRTGRRPSRRLAAGAAALATLFATACTKVVPGEPPPVQSAGMTCKPQSVTRLYLGTQMPDGQVDEAAWQAFVAGTIAPRFGAGFTVLEAQGQWRAADGRVVSERSRVLEVVGDDDVATRARLAEVVVGYKQRFRQEAVLLTQSQARACV